jgi:hypothetical protein
MKRIEALLFWAWVVLSGIWVTTVLLFMDVPHAHAPFAAVPASSVATIAVGPPALLLGLGLVGMWFGRGYLRGP